MPKLFQLLVTYDNHENCPCCDGAGRRVAKVLVVRALSSDEARATARSCGSNPEIDYCMEITASGNAGVVLIK